MEYDKERVKRGIKMCAINPSTKQIIDTYKKFPPTQPYEYLLIPEEKFKFPADMGVYGDKILFVSPKENFGITIESKELAEMLKNSFDLACQEAKRFYKNHKKKFLKK